MKKLNDMHKVKIYSTEWCVFCTKAKEWLIQHNIKFEEVDVGEDEKAAEEMIEKSGQNGVPVIEVDGKIIKGFNKEELKEALGIVE